MEDLKVERLDHLGIISGVIKDLGIIEMIDDRIAPAIPSPLLRSDSMLCPELARDGDSHLWN